jgi:hypothetical protein
MLMKHIDCSAFHDVSDWSLNHLSPHQPKELWSQGPMSNKQLSVVISGRDRENNNKINDERRDDLATKGTVEFLVFC